MTRKYRVQWTDTAKSDLYSIVEYIFDDNPTNAFRILEKIKTSGEAHEQNPKRSRYVPELRELDVYIYRELIVKP
jgi:plasmid stabilization system protein ParE